MKPYRTALDRMRRVVDELGREIWVEKRGPDGKPEVFYSYDSRGRLREHRRTGHGIYIEPARYERFGEDVERNRE